MYRFAVALLQIYVVRNLPTHKMQTDKKDRR